MMKAKARHRKSSVPKNIQTWYRILFVVCFGVVLFIISNFYKKTYVVYTDNTRLIAEKRVDEMGFPLRWSYIAEKGSTYEGETYEYKLIFNVLFWFGLPALLNVWWNSDENTRD